MVDGLASEESASGIQVPLCRCVSRFPYPLPETLAATLSGYILLKMGALNTSKHFILGTNLYRYLAVCAILQGRSNGDCYIRMRVT